ncbi:MAG: DUF2339 domain-containing protein [Saprospiraceae bacterium]|nr:DUF2339 domain-containing protein [Saprospiraceae bacterium]
MNNENDKIEKLLDRLEAVIKKQESFSVEIDTLRKEIIRLQMSRSGDMELSHDELVPEISPLTTTSPYTEPVIRREMESDMEINPENIAIPETISPVQSPKKALNFEKLIGENLINKLGIGITILGVAIGAKYSIDNDLISPLTRIILGYLMGIGLMGLGMKLKKNYHNYSAVLVSGAIAIMYFITYAAYSFYGLFPIELAFAMMVLFTIFSVVTATHYNKQVIAHIGLVGAYAAPFLLSEGSGRIDILFGYMAIINIGVLFIAFRKYWKLLYVVAFVLTWIIFLSWYNISYEKNTHFWLAFVYLTVFFVIFYAVFLAYKLIQKEKFAALDIGLLLLNSFIFYGVGYSLLDGYKSEYQLLGLFTVLNALIHFLVTWVIYKMKLADKNLFYFVAGLVLVFITIAIPVQLEGNWVTLLWILQASLLFWIGRTKNVPPYEKMSYPLMILALVSVMDDWTDFYSWSTLNAGSYIPVLNICFLTSILVIGCFVFIFWLHKKHPIVITDEKKTNWNNLLTFFFGATVIALLYFSFLVQISTYFQNLYLNSLLEIKDGDELVSSNYNGDILLFEQLWIINYSTLFFSILCYFNIKRFENKTLGLINFSLLVWCLLTFLINGLYHLTDLRSGYVNQNSLSLYNAGIFNILIRYISLAFAGIGIFSMYQYLTKDFMKPVNGRLRIPFDVFWLIFVLIVLSTELISWMDLAKMEGSYKLGLSILWGVYALILIAAGIWKNKKHLRIFAIALFSVTLLKLFFYDIAHLDTIAKTIIFISLGILLLITSFLYNKYHKLITEDDEN